MKIAESELIDNAYYWVQLKSDSKDNEWFIVQYRYMSLVNYDDSYNYDDIINCIHIKDPNND